MSFFESELVKKEMIEVSNLQESIYKNMLTFYKMNYEEKKFHISLLEKLLDKQKILYTRISLSNDPQAKEMKERIMDSAVLMGMPRNMDMNIIFNNMTSLVQMMKEQLESENENIDP